MSLGGKIDSAGVTNETAIFFFYSIAKAYPSLQNEPEFFSAINSFLQSKMDQLSEKECEVCLDSWKLNQSLITPETKTALAERKILLISLR